MLGYKLNVCSAQWQRKPFHLHSKLANRITNASFVKRLQCPAEQWPFPLQYVHDAWVAQGIKRAITLTPIVLDLLTRIAHLAYTDSHFSQMYPMVFAPLKPDYCLTQSVRVQVRYDTTKLPRVWGNCTALELYEPIRHKTCFSSRSDLIAHGFALHLLPGLHANMTTHAMFFN